MGKFTMKDFIYLDHNATTPIDPDAAAFMKNVMEEEFGNPSSGYFLGARAKQKVLPGKGEVQASFTAGWKDRLHVRRKRIQQHRPQRNHRFKRPGDFHIITSTVEHPAVVNPALFLLELGVQCTVLPWTIMAG